MRDARGIPVSSGVVIGPAFVLAPQEFTLPERSIGQDEVAAELDRLGRALDDAQREILELQRTTGEPHETIFIAHLAILGDPRLREEIAARVRDDLVPPETAVSEVFEGWIVRFRGLEGLIADRDQDFADIQRRILANLVGGQRDPLDEVEGEVILVAEDLTPSRTATLDRSKVIGIAIDRGGRTSHTAIIARSIGIPAVVGLGSLSAEIETGRSLIVDGDSGVVVIDPDEATRAEYRRIARTHCELQRELGRLHGLPAETPDGHRIVLFGNIEFPAEIDEVLANGGEGIGLYRTEFLLQGRSAVPSEADHLSAYRSALARLGGRPLTIRTFDFGADKASPDPRSHTERNPFLGLRSIRLCFDRPDLFRPQLRAILRASALGSVRILFPMISSLGEVRRAREELRRAQDELDREGVSFDPKLPVGVMIEIPSAAIIAERLAPEVDFFSIGTNDLIQYTLAVDRVNELVASLYQPAHPAILRLLRYVADVGRDHGVDVAICGEIAGETLYTVLLIGLGIRELSISPASVPKIKRVIRSITAEEARAVTRRAERMDEPKEIEAYVEGVLAELLESPSDAA